MGFLKKAWKGVTKVAKKTFNTVVDVTIGVVSGEYLFKAAGAIVEFVGADIVDDVLGLDKIGNEVANVGSDLYQVGKVLGGEYHDDMKIIQQQQERLQKQIDSYNNNVDALSEKIDSLIAFHEIFQMAASNRLTAYTDKYGPELTAAIAELERLAAKLRSEYDFVIGLTEGAFVQRLIGSVIMIIGGLMSDLHDIALGKADGATWQRALTTIVLTIVIVLLIFAGPTGWMAIVALILTMVVTFMTLDSMYANGAATGAIMSMFDYIFNDLLNLDDLIGQDFDKFDKDHEDYEQMVMYTKLAMTLAAAGLTWASNAGNYVTAAQYGTQPWSQQTAMLASQDAGMSASALANSTNTVFGIDTSTYSSIYKAYSVANDVNDALNSKKAYEELASKFKADSLSLEEAINSKYRKNFMKHYKDTAYFLQDQQEYIDRYLWSMTSENMYVDPYGTTPVANMRFTPDNDTRMISFGYEDIFDESTQAGSAGYFNSILYGN